MSVCKPCYNQCKSFNKHHSKLVSCVINSKLCSKMGHRPRDCKEVKADTREGESDESETESEEESTTSIRTQKQG